MKIPELYDVARLPKTDIDLKDIESNRGETLF